MIVGRRAAINRCPPFFRREPTLLLAANVPARQGVSFQKPDDGTFVADWGKIGATPASCTPLQSNGAMDCNTESANDYIWLKNELPLKVVSGSQVLYGPVVISTCSYDGGDCTADCATGCLRRSADRMPTRRVAARLSHGA